ncbi:baculoviral IAP repeat-containing protein 5b isoform X1 [Stigmatopora argus]
MANIEVMMGRFFSFGKMYSADLREKSFATWPFREDCSCTPEMMAKAGFVHCPSENEPDVVSCFFCLIELEGWEPTDDPWFEHTKRSPSCGFLLLGKDFTQMTVAEFYRLEMARVKVYVRKLTHKKMDSLRNAIDVTLKDINSQLNSL